MNIDRSAGILLHPTSLPGPEGIGDIGPAAYDWVDFLAASGCGFWQILPLGPTGYGDSPYQSFSAFAGNPFLVSPTLLMDHGLIQFEDFSQRPVFAPKQIDYGRAIDWKNKLLDLACRRFEEQRPAALVQPFNDFCQKHADWLQDYALFMTIKESMGGKPWNEWPTPLKRRESSALDSFSHDHTRSINRHILRQFFFYQQWQSLRSYAAAKRIRILGDIPIFVAFDSADAWSNPDLFHFDKDNNPTIVAGVPPDYFSPTGQLWGNPLYKWEKHKEEDYSWWKKRLRATLETVDYIRLDHFRGFAGYWAIPAGMPTAEIGDWLPGPAEDFFISVSRSIKELPLIAEDLGVITQDVSALRDRFQFPGMKILQFAFSSDNKNPFLPFNFSRNCVVYTGTHDNNTTIGWFVTAEQGERAYCCNYLGTDGKDIAWDLIRLAWSSIANLAIAPIQDFLRLDATARMNFPGTPSGNWCWRLEPSQLIGRLSDEISLLNTLYARSQEKA